MATLPPKPDWRTRRLDDGRVVEFLDAYWDPDPTRTAGAFGVRVVYTVDGTVQESLVMLTAEQILAAFGDAG